MKTQLILEILKKAGRATDFLLNIFLGGFDYKRLKRKVFYPTLPDFSEINKMKFTPRLLEKEKHRFYSLLSNLKRQGFIKKDQKGKRVFWRITPLGEKRCEKLKVFFHFPKVDYKQEKDKGMNIVVFDIPERQRSKRDWLRHALMALDFIMLQKSVWIGKNKLPEEFLKTLAELNLMDFVHIFKISKTGTIKELNSLL